MLRRSQFRVLILTLFATCFLGGVACQSAPNPCIITFRDGRTIHAQDWPELNETTGYYRCRRAVDGQFVVFKQDEIASVVSTPTTS